jgi:Replication-relaxation
MDPDSYRAAHRYDGAIIQRQRCEEPEPVALRQRDLGIVRDVWRYHFLTTEQLRELWWPDRTPQAARRRLVKLFRGGYLERFRPYSPRGSYEWTYYLAAPGHRLLRQLGAIDPDARFKPREVFDYGRALHDVQVNAWVLAYRRLLGTSLIDWQGEHQLTPPRATRHAQPALDDAWSIEGLRDPRPRPVVPDAALQIENDGAESPRTFLIEYDRTSRTDKNFDKFRRYDNLLGSWWRHTQLADHGDAPYILFVCQNQAQRDDFLTRADQELTGHRWHPSHPTEEHQYVGRRRILFCNERDIHHRQPEARRLPPYPPGHPARNRSDAEIRAVRLPGQPAPGTFPQPDYAEEVESAAAAG